MIIGMRFSVTICSVVLTFKLSALEDLPNKALKSAQKEALELAKNHQEEIFIDPKNFAFEADDLLPEEEKGKQFDSQIAKKQAKNAHSDFQQTEVYKFIQQSQKAEQIEKEEQFLITSDEVIKDPLQSLQITQISKTTQKEEIDLQTCTEVGSYQAVIEQKLVVSVKPEIKIQIKHCLGHKDHKSYYWKSDAEDKKDKMKKQLSKDKELFHFQVEIPTGGLTKDYKVEWTYSHHDNSSVCKHFSTEYKIEQPEEVKEEWINSQPFYLEELLADPNCSLTYTSITEGPESRIIQGKSIFRDKWAQKLLFSCEPRAGSACDKLRKLGGIIVSKKCVKYNVIEECIEWQKTYDLGKKASHIQTLAQFEKDVILGMGGEFDASYEKNGDFSSSITSLAVLSDLKKSLEDQGGNFSEDFSEIFSGEKLKCKKSIAENALYDCCKKLDGFAVKAALANCSSEEVCLSKHRSDGKCHHIGKEKNKLGMETVHYFCCFPTKLARVVQEQGRKQLGIGWGEGPNAKCRGLSLEEFQKIDFNQVDFSEVIEDYQVNQEELKNKIQKTIQNFEEMPLSDFENKTSLNLKAQYEKIQNH